MKAIWVPAIGLVTLLSQGNVANVVNVPRVVNVPHVVSIVDPYVSLAVTVSVTMAPQILVSLMAAV